MTSNSNNLLQQDWPLPEQFKKSIRVEFSIFISLMILLLMLIAGSIITDRYIDAVTQAAADKLLVQARSYSGPAGKLIISTTGPDALLLSNICRKLGADNEDISWVGITDRDNVLLAHTDIKKVAAGDALIPITGGEYTELLRQDEGFDLSRDTIHICVPINEGNVLVGRLHLASSAEKIAEARTGSIIAVVSVSVAVLLVGLPLTMIGLHRKLRPIRIITDSLKSVKFDDINLDIPVSGKNELGYLSETLKVMGNKLNIAQREMIEAERIGRELEIAREIQAKILPSEFPATAHYTFSGFYRSAREVGGDYYDFIKISDTKVAFLVADVSGKSLPGMLVMLLTRDIIRERAHRNPDPSSLLSAVNRELLPNIKKGMFVTMFYGVLDAVTGIFEFASAGHNPLVVLNPDREPLLIKTKGYPLGMVPPEQFNMRLEKGKLKLNAGDWLVQYTDGINEAQSPAGEEYGMDRMLNQLSRQVSFSPEELIATTIADIDHFVGQEPQFDDITLIAMKLTAATVDNISKERVLESQ